MKSGRKIFFDLFLNFIINSYFLSINNFFDSLTIFVFTSNFSGNFYSLEIIFLFYAKSDQTFSDLADLFSLSLSSNDFAISQQCSYLTSESCFSLCSSSAEFSIFCHFYFPPFGCAPAHASSDLLSRGLASTYIHLPALRSSDLLMRAVIIPYSSLWFNSRPSSFSFASTSSRDLRPRLRTFIISSEVRLQSSSTVLIPALFRQL